MLIRILPPRLAALALTAATIWAGCVKISRVETEALDPTNPSVRVQSPVKAHLVDGSTVVYPNGVSVDGDSLLGLGHRYDLRLATMGAVAAIPLDSVVGMESFRTGVNVPATVALSVPATAIGLVAGVALFKALFGSCPTFYADSAGHFALEAEGFSYSIAPLFETRDVDALRARPDADGSVRLEVRNEALETHYINHLEVLEIRHRSDERIVPDVKGRPIAVRDIRTAARARDRSGRDVTALLAAADNRIFETNPTVLARVTPEDLTDQIELTLANPSDADSVAIVLRLRNSLLTTVLLYELMLGSAGAGSLDWLGIDLAKVGPALELGTWYAGRMGLRIAVDEGGGYREVARIGDSGPIAWKEVAAVVPAAAGDSVRLRLTFPADSWRIDRVAISTDVRRPDSRSLSAVRVVGADGETDGPALAALVAADETYLQTSPGQRFSVHFDPTLGDAESRSYLLASQGYYTEWIRRDWIRNSIQPSRFLPSDSALFSAMVRWRARHGELEREFYATRIPVR